MKRIPMIIVGVSVLLVLFSGCAPNKAWRIDMTPRDCTGAPDACSAAIWERHPDYDLAFIEFTERGNVFSNQYQQAVYDRLWDLSETAGPLAIMVFVHGWKHNASTDDGNVKSFRTALKNLSQSNILGARKLIGVYIGWRGKTLYGLGTENLTYWDRKAVAQEVGKGGVTDVFLELEKIDRSNPDNYFFIVGHSFGGAITLSALNEIFMARLKGAYQREDSSLEPFGEGTVIINPAIEANQILQLKEESMALGGANQDQPRLLHVVSSMGDIATHKVFPIGQALGVGLTWNHNNIERVYKDKVYMLSEYELDTTAVGNYAPFHTAALLDYEKIEKLGSKKLLKKFKMTQNQDNDRLGRWMIHSYCKHPPGSTSKGTDHFPCDDNETVTFVYTTKSFISDHNDVFNENVMAYFSTLVSEALFKQDPRNHFPQCAEDGTFLFESCFNYHWKRYKQ